jgi:hypothetical protein
VVALAKIEDEELRGKHPDELVRIIRRLESESRSLVAEHSSIIKDVNRRMQIYLLEIRGLKDINQKLQDTEALGDRVLNGARPGERDMLAETELLLALDPDTLVADGKDEMLIFYQ